MKAKAAVFMGANKPFRIQEFDVCPAPAGYARMELIASGVCGTDVHFHRGKLSVNAPTVIGHEFVGRIADVNEEEGKAYGLSVGDCVIADIAVPCGGCLLCKSGDDANCVNMQVTNGGDIGTPPYLYGGYAEVNFTPLKNLIKIPEGIDPATACVFACPGPTAMLASGSPIIHSDKLSLLRDGQFGLLSSMFPLLGRPARSVNFLKESIPSVLDFGRCGDFEIIAFINWGENEKKLFTIDKKGYIFEYWTKNFYGYSDGQMTIEVPAHQVKLFTIGNGEAIVPIGVDDTILPQLNWNYRDGELRIRPLKEGEGIYLYSERPIEGNVALEKVCDRVYLAKGGKNTEEIIVR